MKEVDKAYAAGIIDGEGCISIRLSKKKYITPTVDVANTNKEVLLWLQDGFGGGIYSNKDSRPTRKPSYHWFIAAARAKKCIKTILPYLIIKKLQAELTLSIKIHGTSRRNALGQIRASMTEKDFERNRQLKKKMLELNRRGAA